MTYRSDDYCKLDRNHTRIYATLLHINLARDFGRMKYADSMTITATDRTGEKIEITITSSAKNAIAEAGANYCINTARAMNKEPLEEIDFDKAAKV